MKAPLRREQIGERDVKTAVESLTVASFNSRFIRTGCNAADPKWKSPSGQPIQKYIRNQMDGFRKDVLPVRGQRLHGGVFQKINSSTILTIAYHNLFKPVIPTARDLLCLRA